VYWPVGYLAVTEIGGAGITGLVRFSIGKIRGRIETELHQAAIASDSTRSFLFRDCLFLTRHPTALTRTEEDHQADRRVTANRCININSRQPFSLDGNPSFQDVPQQISRSR
jgi:hypothetical protein